MVSERIKYAMAHLSRKQHTRLLARPNWRRLRRPDANIVVDPNAISRAALKCKPSKRIKIMARPKYVTKKYDALDYPAPYQRVHPKTLAATATTRIRNLAVPKKRVLEQRIFEFRKPPPRDHDWERHRMIIQKLATPKIYRKPKPFVPRKRWRPFNMRRIENLAEPVIREIPIDRDPFKVSRSALKYRITDRIMRLYYPKTEFKVMKPRIPGAVSRAALKAIASSRTIFLAKPSKRPAGMETDLREDAFTVSPAALKAKCSRRLKKLAKPRNYKPRKR
ncbi:PREDICTED: testicular haploid expressed gene protein-like [Polistes dominula]|uniref:Testicular haploid expressed gene protein-like n=1 Tax=Polistes dominula TaxID=743375 RepID=A0ABM1ISU4_POLDO|nr:PREDICTED: testicular haploid expressed gene protein-like [Polistes dominula]